MDKTEYIKNFREWYGRSPTSKEMIYYDKGYNQPAPKNTSKSKIAMLPQSNKNNKIIETKKNARGTYEPIDKNKSLVPSTPRYITHNPKKKSWWQRRKEAKANRPKQPINWKTNVQWNRGSALRTTGAAARRGANTAANIGYSLPGPFQVWTLAWQKTTTAMKTLAVIVFALVLLFVPWGVFYYTGWAVGAGFMFLVSLIFWVFISLFNGIAYVLVSLINGITSIIMGALVGLVEAFLGWLKIGNLNPQTGVYEWDNGRYLLTHSLITYSQIADVPSLYHVITPTWQPFMNDTIIGHVLGLLGVSLDFSWLTSPFEDFYTNLPAEQAVVLGCFIIALPILFLAWVYYRNRHLLHNYRPYRPYY